MTSTNSCNISTCDDNYEAATILLAEKILTAVFLFIFIIITIVGNILVIMSVFTYRPLRSVQNFYIVSLAAADLCVSILVMPFNILYNVLDKWIFGAVFCDMWLTFDVMCCTASILNLCAIALDRYYAIHDPINYAQKRTLKRVLIMIGLVWGLSAVISIPPIIGWNNWDDRLNDIQNNRTFTCKLTDERGYVIYSASGSFYIPLLIMTVVYFKIFLATRRRLRQRRTRSNNTMDMSRKSTSYTAPRKKNVTAPTRLESPQETKKEEKERTTSFTNIPDNRPDDEQVNTDNKDVNISDKCIVFNGDKHTARSKHSTASNRPYNIRTEIRDSIRRKRPSQPANTPCANQKLNTTPIAEPKSIMYQFLEERQKISLSRERRAARTLGIIMGVFVLCWLPFFLMYVILPFCPNCQLPNTRMENFIVWLGYINSGLNPVIYTIFNIDFRRSFKRLLAGKRR